MLNKQDINKYNTTQMIGRPMGRTDGEMARSAGATAQTVLSMFGKFIKTFLLICIVTGCLVGFSVLSVIWSYHDTKLTASLSSFKLNESSFVYVTDALHIDSVDTAEWTEHMRYNGTEIRTRVDFTQIPQIMKDAMVAIEDKRFYQHNGVDWYRTLGAVYGLITGTDSAGGSTITQQLIKNLTGENQVSITRKIREIFMALNLEKEYTKDEILEAYLNVVNFGNGYYGVQAAAQGYFGKDIWDCSIAECATIAATTQNPSALCVFYYPEANKARRDTVIEEMYDQGKITKAEYDQAMEESDNLKLRGIDFDVNETDSEDAENSDASVQDDVWNWYDEEVFEDAVDLLIEYANVDEDNAIDMLYNSGLKIYSAQNVALQEGFERLLKNNWQEYTYDDDIWSGACLMEYDGRILAVNSNKVDSDGNYIEKTENRGWNNVSTTVNSPGSSIKPIGVYAPAIENKYITYGSVLKDEPLPGYFDDGSAGPSNFSGSYSGTVNVDFAITESLNAPMVQLINEMTPMLSYQFLTENLHISSLTEADAYNLSGVSIGGLENGISVREMTAAYLIFGNGGKYYEPYTIYRIEDNEGNVIYDYQQREAEQAISFDTATIMNKLLHLPIEGTNGLPTARQVYRSDLDQIGKTGTSEDYNNIWYMGGTPSVMCGIWYGHETLEEVYDTNGAKSMYNGIIDWLEENYYDFLHSGSYTLSDNVVQLSYCRSSGKRPGSGCTDIATGWYSQDNVPGTCNGGSDHINGDPVTPSPSPTVSASPSPSPSASPTASPTPVPTAEPTAVPTPVPTPEPTPEPTPIPTPEPTPIPTPEPTPIPTPEPTPEPPPATEAPPAETTASGG